MPARPASYKVICARYKRNGDELKRLANIKIPPTLRSLYLDMTDEEIDSRYWNIGKADRTRMKKEAATERLRKEVQKTLGKERNT